jgi:AcrR family transcriptional regulator
MTRLLPVLGQQGPLDGGERGEPRRERADALKNRARILDAARKVMKKKTLDELCMDELAALAGVGKGTLYRRFEDKQALLHALLDDDERALQEAVKASFGAAVRDPRAAAVALLDSLFAFVVDHAHVLAAAEASARGAARFNCAPYAWRHAVVTGQLARARVADGAAAEQLADMLLATMSGEVVTRALSNAQAGGPEGIKEKAHAFFATVCSAPL